MLSWRFRPAVDAIRRSRSLRDQGPDRPAGYGKADPSLDHLHAMQFRAHQEAQVSGVWPASRPLEVTVTVRWIPVTAAYGTRVTRLARTAMLAPGGDGSQLGWRVRPAPSDHCTVDKPQMRRGSVFLVSSWLQALRYWLPASPSAPGQRWPARGKG